MALISRDANPQDVTSCSWQAQHREMFGSGDKLKVILQFEKLQSVNRSMELLLWHSRKSRVRAGMFARCSGFHECSLWHSKENRNAQIFFFFNKRFEVKCVNLC